MAMPRCWSQLLWSSCQHHNHFTHHGDLFLHTFNTEDCRVVLMRSGLLPRRPSVDGICWLRGRTQNCSWRNGVVEVQAPKFPVQEENDEHARDVGKAM